MKTDNIVIKCPKCGYEYLPCEIFYPDSFLGKCSSIIKDDNGKIEFFSGDSMNLSETFICEHCGYEFLVNAKVDFEVTEIKDTFDEEVSIPLK